MCLTTNQKSHKEKGGSRTRRLDLPLHCVPLPPHGMRSLMGGRGGNRSMTTGQRDHQIDQRTDAIWKPECRLIPRSCSPAETISPQSMTGDQNNIYISEWRLSFSPRCPQPRQRHRSATSAAKNTPADEPRQSRLIREEDSLKTTEGRARGAAPGRHSPPYAAQTWCVLISATAPEAGIIPANGEIVWKWNPGSRLPFFF